MTRSDLEGRLADLMLERAEGAMTATQTPEKLADLLGGRSPRPRRWVAATVAVAAAAAVVVSAWLVRGDQPMTPTPASPTQEVAESVAADYLEALYRYDLETAEAQLADGAVIDGSADLDAWRSNMRWQGPPACGWPATRVKPETPRLPAPRCAAPTRSWNRLGAARARTLRRQHPRRHSRRREDHHGDRGLAVHAERLRARGLGPFSGWVNLHHRDDVRHMYNKVLTAAKHTPRSISLWERYVAEYVADSQR